MSQHQVMLEKWMLVFIIVGCTSLIFLICFPIDFYLYRRRKRLARERINIGMHKQPAITRAGQMRSYVSMDVSVDDYSDYVEKASGLVERDEPEQSRFVKLVNLFRRQKAEKMFQMRKISLTTSDAKSDIPTLTITKESVNEFDRSTRSSVVSKEKTPVVNYSCDKERNVNHDPTEIKQTVASIEQERLNSDRLHFEENYENKSYNFSGDRVSIKSKNESSTDSPTSVQSQHDPPPTGKPCSSSEEDDKGTDIEQYYTHIDLDDDTSDIDDMDLSEEYINRMNNGNLSTLQIIHVRSNVSQRFFNNVQTLADNKSKRHTYSGENIEHLEITHINNHQNHSPIRSLQSEPNLTVPEVEDDLAELPEVFDDEDECSNSDYTFKDYDVKHRKQKKRSLKRNNTVSPTNDIEEILTGDSSKKIRTKSEEVGNSHRKDSKRRIKKHAFEETSKSLPDLPDLKGQINNIYLDDRY